jgi:hypothetical protein
VQCHHSAHSALPLSGSLAQLQTWSVPAQPSQNSTWYRVRCLGLGLCMVSVRLSVQRWVWHLDSPPPLVDNSHTHVGGNRVVVNVKASVRGYLVIILLLYDPQSRGGAGTSPLGHVNGNCSEWEASMRANVHSHARCCLQLVVEYTYVTVACIRSRRGYSFTAPRPDDDDGGGGGGGSRSSSSSFETASRGCCKSTSPAPLSSSASSSSSSSS